MKISKEEFAQFRGALGPGWEFAPGTPGPREDAGGYDIDRVMVWRDIHEHKHCLYDTANMRDSLVRGFPVHLSWLVTRWRSSKAKPTRLVIEVWPCDVQGLLVSISQCRGRVISNSNE